ncbi:MAG: alcohol dehydrogenase [Gammaproteobacteria bacterium RIFCSPHIGHO2_12_FULL_41_15]|nr:MAG: alcohol dehydrogenase [Gammaproteobacteria bacterium RIFCSPHIGHO2_12_FULL_41_15]
MLLENKMVNWHYPTEIYCGIGAAATLSHYCQTLNIKKVLFVTDNNLLKFSSIEKIYQSISLLFPTIFADIKPNPTSQNVIEGIEVFKKNNCDGVIAVGGGSVLDVAKVIALMAKQTLDLWALEDVGDNYKNADIHKIVPCIAIPTTAGTGSEVGRASLIIDTAQKRKRFIFHPNIMPNIVILDAELTVALPPKLTAATGMDALAHNLEALCVDAYHPMADGIAMEGLRLIKENLAKAVKNGKDLEARQNMLVAASMGAVAFQKGLGAVHSLSHPIGARYDAHHGLLNAIFMPYVLQFNRNKIEEKMMRLAAYMGLDHPSFEAVLNWLLDLREEIGIPHTLVDINIKKSDHDILVDDAFKDPSTSGNPNPLSIEALKNILLAATTGDM